MIMASVVTAGLEYELRDAVVMRRLRSAPAAVGGMICSSVAGWRSPPFLFRLTTQERVRSKTMGEQTPSMGGLHQPPEKIESLLSLVRENLDMDVAFVSEFAGDKLVFR